jgi:hypothetical protein
MNPHSEAAAPMGSIIGNGGLGISKKVVLSEYQNPVISATEIATAIIATRLRISPCLARVVCELAQIGGRVG